MSPSENRVKDSQGEISSDKMTTHIPYKRLKDIRITLNGNIALEKCTDAYVFFPIILELFYSNSNLLVYHLGGRKRVLFWPPSLKLKIRFSLCFESRMEY